MFWEGNNIETYKLYQSLRDKNDEAGLAKLIPLLIREYPDMVRYIVNRIDSCFGRHIVYVVDTNKGIKIGYTKNDVERRFGETRYENSNDFQINEVLRTEEFQAKGAVEFESKLKKVLKPYGVQSEMVMPGKSELYSKEHLKTILSEYDKLKGVYKEIIGLKSPN